MAFDPDKFLQEDDATRKQKIRPKSPSVANEFDGVRQYLKNVALASPEALPISSAWRSPAANAAAGGVPNSFHKTGEALDIRKIGDQSRNLEHFKKSGFKVIDEGDHYHIEPSKRGESQFDPDEFLRNELNEPGEIPSSSPMPEENQLTNDIKDSGPTGKQKFMALLSGAGRALPFSDLLSAFVETEPKRIKRLVSGNPMNPSELGGEFKRNYKLFKTSQDAIESNAPGYALAGSLPLNVVKYATGTKALSAPLSVGGDFLKAHKYLGGIANLMGKATAGGSTSAAIGQESGIDKSKIPLDFLLGAGGELGAAGLSKLVKVATKPIQSGLKTIRGEGANGILPERVRNEVERLWGVGKWLKEGRQFKESSAKRFGEDVLKSLPKKDAISAADDLGKLILENKKSLGESYKKTVGPIIKKHGLKKASPDTLRKSITGILDEQGLLDKRGNILFDQVDDIIAPERKRFVKTLADVNESLKKNPSIQNLNKKLQDLGSLANFGSPQRTAEEKLIAKLYDSAREDLFNSIEGAVKGSAKSSKPYRSLKRQFEKAAEINTEYGAKLKDGLGGDRLRRVLEEGKSANLDKASSLKSSLDLLDDQALEQGKGTVSAVRDARRMYSENKPILDELSKIIDTKYSEDVIKSAQTRLPGSFVSEIIKKQPNLKPQIAEVLMNNIAQSGTSARTLTKAIDRFDRETLKRVLDSDTYSRLLDVEKAFHASENVAPGYKWIADILQKGAGGRSEGKKSLLRTRRFFKNSEKAIRPTGPLLKTGVEYAQ